MVSRIDDASFADRLIKAGPAATTFKFSIASEKRVTANGAIESADLMRMLEGAATGPFRPLLPGNGIDIPWQDLFPLVIRQGDGTGVLPGVNRVFFLVGCIHISCFLLAGLLAICTLLQ